MFTRIILQELEAWKNKPNRKPLILTQLEKNPSALKKLHFLNG
jgi:hypothetical protein